MFLILLITIQICNSSHLHLSPCFGVQNPGYSGSQANSSGTTHSMPSPHLPSYLPHKSPGPRPQILQHSHRSFTVPWLQVLVSIPLQCTAGLHGHCGQEKAETLAAKQPSINHKQKKPAFRPPHLKTKLLVIIFAKSKRSSYFFKQKKNNFFEHWIFHMASTPTHMRNAKVNNVISNY